MPGIGGVALAQRLAVERPDVKILLMSGHADDDIVRHGVASGEFPLLPKPFTEAQLVRRIRSILGKVSVAVADLDRGRGTLR